MSVIAAIALSDILLLGAVRAFNAQAARKRVLLAQRTPIAHRGQPLFQSGTPSVSSAQRWIASKVTQAIRAAVYTQSFERLVLTVVHRISTKARSGQRRLRSAVTL
ncbi:MAG: hypothetical protein JWO13_2735 [Acidobacteriales bacterium]|nr:hypothetical protein [Terriglobales bacterium]